MGKSNPEEGWAPRLTSTSEELRAKPMIGCIILGADTNAGIAGALREIADEIEGSHLIDQGCSGHSFIGVELVEIDWDVGPQEQWKKTS